MNHEAMGVKQSLVRNVKSPTLLQLLANGSRYDGQNVRVIGYLSLEEERIKNVGPEWREIERLRHENQLLIKQLAGESAAD